MNTIRFPLIALLLAAISLVGAEPSAQKPNIIFFLVDDLGQRDLGCYGSYVLRDAQP